MKKRILIILSLLLIGGLIIQGNSLGLFDKKTAYAVGDLNVVWGSDPLFNYSNIAPGFNVTKIVNVANGAASPRPVAVKGVLTSDPGNMKSVMDIEIKQGVNTLYSNTLADFFSKSAGPEGINLSTLNPNTNTDYSFKVTFIPEAGNEYQNKNIVFDLQIGVGFSLPFSCANINFNGKTIYGTAGNDNITGTSKNDLIITFEGKDKISSGSGDDCVITAGSGDDNISTGSGNDTVITGSGNDKIDTGSGNDTVFSGSGNDKVDLGEGNDFADLGYGNDKALGGSGNDIILGGNGNDILDGGSGNDTLTGGADNDKATGNSGTDTCTAEIRNSCEL